MPYLGQRRRLVELHHEDDESGAFLEGVVLGEAVHVFLVSGAYEATEGVEDFEELFVFGELDELPPVDVLHDVATLGASVLDEDDSAHFAGVEDGAGFEVVHEEVVFVDLAGVRLHLVVVVDLGRGLAHVPREELGEELELDLRLVGLLREGYFFGVWDAFESLEVFFCFLFFFDCVGGEKLDVLVRRAVRS